MRWQCQRLVHMSTNGISERDAASVAARRTRRRLRRALLAAFLLSWLGGGIGWLVQQAVPLILPAATRDVRVLRFSAASPPGADPRPGIVLRTNAPRLESLAQQALGWRYHLLPRGLLPRYLTVQAEVRVTLATNTPAIWLPVVVRLAPEQRVPILSATLSAKQFNQLLDHDDSFAHSDKRKKYFLGHYRLSNEILFETVRLRSMLTAKEAGRPVTYRRIEGTATGRVRYWFDDSMLAARTTAKVGRMDVRLDARFQHFVDGISVAYDLRITRLDADFSNVMPLLDKRLAGSLREALQDSMNRPRRLERLARKRLPHWLPLDLGLELDVVPGDG